MGSTYIRIYEEAETAMNTEHNWSKRMKQILPTLADEPWYVKTHGEYDNEVYLIKSEQDLIDTMLMCAKYWYDSGQIFRLDYCDVDRTYEEFFEREIGMSRLDYDRLMALDIKSKDIESIKKRASSLKEDWDYEVGIITKAKFFDEILLDREKLANRAGTLYNLLNNMEYNHCPMFSFGKFNEIKEV